MKLIQWPIIDSENNLKLSENYRADECLRFHEDGSITSNGGRVEHHEITDEQVEILPESDQIFVRDFLAGNYEIAK